MPLPSPVPPILVRSTGPARMTSLEEIGHLHMEATRANRAWVNTTIPDCEFFPESGIDCAVAGKGLEDICEPCSFRNHLRDEMERSWLKSVEATGRAVDRQDRVEAARDRLRQAQLEYDLAR